MDQKHQALTQANWPKEPYKGFAYYNFADLLIFTCRDDDVEDCLQYLTEPNTRTLLLHGRTGCGKSSFLRAGLIPELESRGFGFVFLRRKEGDNPTLIRCTSDPITRIAEELFQFTDHPWRFETAIDSREIDVSSGRMGKDDVRSFAEACRDPYFLMKVLKEISSKLVHTLVIILDQAEEAITQDEERSPFFDFLKLFNAVSLNVKLVIALRTERFGEFFGYLHFGASVITDVKQYFLRGLDRHQVRQAIELPTLKVKVKDCNPPFEVYGFVYEPGLIDRIVTDLFAAPPSGGILPLMQVVCRGLYNEVRNLPAPRTITKQLYNSGGGVSGRVDQQIGQALQAAIKAAQPSIRDIDEEERKWRTGLYRLVRTQPDGTVGTDLKSEEAMLAILKSVGISEGIPAILGDLTQPDVLILRSFKVTSIDSESETILYCLGHDAVGLVLRQWMLREEEAQKRRRIEMQERKRLKIAEVVGAIVLAMFVVAGLYIGELTNRRQLVEVSVLQSVAETRFRSDPGISAAAALNSFLVAKNIWWNKPTKPQVTLANVAAALPQLNIHSSLPSRTAALGGGYVLPALKKFIFWNTVDGIEIVSWDGQQRWKVPLASLLGRGRAANYIFLANAVEAGNDLFMLRFTNGPGDEFVSVLRNDQVLGVFDTKYFRGLSPEVQSLFDKQTTKAPLHLYADAGVVYLYDQPDVRTVTIAAFFLEGAGTTFQVGGQVNSISPEGTVYVHMDTLPPGIAIVAAYKLATASSNASDLQKNVGRSLVALTAYDLRKRDSQTVWSINSNSSAAASISNSGVQDCVSQNICTFYNQDRGSSGFLLIAVPVKAKQSDSMGTDDSASGTLIAVDAVTKRATNIDINAIIQSAQGGTLGSNSLIRPSVNLGALTIGGTFDSIILAASNGSINALIDVFRIEGAEPQFIGTYTAANPGGRIFFTPEGQAMFLIDSSEVRKWDISVPLSGRSTSLANDKSPDRLIAMICSSGLPETANRNTWRSTIGIDVPLTNPCGS